MNEKQQPTAGAPEYFEPGEGHACYAPVGVMSLQQAVSLVTEAIVYARERQIARLLVDATGLSGFPSPSVPDRYWLAREWAMAATFRVALALVVPAFMIDPERFGVKVAVNYGTRADVFAGRPEALSWLLSEKPSSVLVNLG